MKYFTGSEYTLALEAEARQRRFMQMTLAQRIDLVNLSREGTAALLEELTETSRAAWEACGGNGGERL
jgi:hypothetical protein